MPLVDDINSSLNTNKTNKEYKLKDLGYNDTTAFFTDPKNARYIADVVSKIPNTRRAKPPSYWDYIKYPHRREFDAYHLRIGDSCFVIPPEFISIKISSQTEQNVSIRQENSIKTKHGYSRKEIALTLYFNGLEQINGYKVDSPETCKYFVDGLRPLIAQFMCTPFLPIENEFINITNNISNVALINLNVGLVPGFPECVQATLIMQEFNATPYIEAPNAFYDDFIDWDLFRFYYQKKLEPDSATRFKKLPAISGTSGTFDGKFSLSILEGDFITNKTKSEEFYKKENFKLMVSDKDDIAISEMNFSVSNIVPIIQLSDHSSPTMQYMGGMDVIFTITFETTDNSISGVFAELQSKIQAIVRKNRMFSGLGFVIFDNEFVNMTGTSYLMIDDVSISTVPDFPDLHSISLQCISYNKSQAFREKLNSTRPFANNREGKKSDCISQDVYGVVNKIYQECTAEAFLAETELYPDLCLPMFEEVNAFIPQVIAFRAANNLTQIQYSKYPNQSCIVPLKGPDSLYEKYMDPDFYVFYPIAYKDISDKVFELIHGVKPTAAPVTAVDFSDMGVATVNADGSVSYPVNPIENADGSGKSRESGSIKGFIDVAMSKIGCGYVWGADGATLTPSILNELKGRFGKDNYPSTVDKWMNKQVFDCSGFVSYCLRQVGIMKSGERYGCSDLYSKECTPISKADLKIGDLLFRGPGAHVAIYIGDNKTVEAMGTAYGVVIGDVRDSFNYFGRVKGLSDIAPKETPVDLTPVNNTNPFPGYKTGLAPITDAVNKLRPMVTQYANAKGIKDIDLIMALIQQESGGDAHALATDPMQSAESQGMRAGSLNNVEKSIEWGIEAFKKALDGAGGNVPLMLQSYNFGPGFISYAKSHGGMSQANVNAFSDMQAKQMGWNSYGDKNYVQNVLKFYNGTGNNASNYIPTPNTATNPNLGKVYGDKTAEYVGKNIGKPLYLSSPLVDAMLFLEDSRYHKKIEAFEIADEEIINKACVDMVKFSNKGRLVRAFPSYVLMILDDSNTWLDARKLWTNYYIYKSVIDISIFHEYANPVGVANIRLTNTYSNLSRATYIHRQAYSIMNDNEYKDIDKVLYQWTGAILGGTKLTQNLVEQHNIMFDNVIIKEGCRLHIRMGYGSNPLNYPISFNGTIVEIDTSDIVNIVASSDGAELVNNIISASKNKVNKLTNLQSEPSDIVASLLDDRDAWFANVINSNWFEKSKYGIEHFGIYMNADTIMKDQTDKYSEAYQDHKDNFFNVVCMDIFLTAKSAVTGFLNWSQKIALATQENQYDLNKNVYMGNYLGRPFCMDSYFGNYDKEDNINFFLFNKTPWDAMQTVTQFLPEFVCQPMYHQFDSRLFYGLPIWCAKYAYDIDTKKKDVLEYGKTFSQFHCIDSFTDIIDNNVKSSSRELFTNCVSSYSQGGDSHVSPTIYADRSIDNAKQKTKVIDTSVSQDYLGWDWLYAHIGLAVAKNAAIQISISNILDSFANVYQGAVYILGDGSIKPCDYLYLNDNYIQMHGLCTVKQTVHSIGVDTGFISEIHPGMIGTSNQKNSGMVNVIKSFLSFGVAYSSVVHVRKQSVNLIDNMGRLFTSAKYLDHFIDSKQSKITYVSNIIYEAYKNGTVLSNFNEINGEIIALYKNELSNVKDPTRKDGTVARIVSGVETVVIAGAVVVAAIGFGIEVLIATLLVNTLAIGLVDIFCYNHTVSVYPLIYKGTPFIAGMTGYKTLIPGFKESDIEWFNAQS